jgi:transcriptional regulator with XRE-family HTH domain
MSVRRHPAPVDDHRIGAAIRAIRIRKGLRQRDVATRAGVSRWAVMHIERGRLAALPFGTIRAVASSLDARLDTTLRWQGGDLPRLLSARHSAMHETMARFFGDLPDWTAEPEVSFSIYGERGIIDVLAWHPGRRILLVIELKTEVVDVNEMLGTLDRKRRLARSIARDRGWEPLEVGVWLVLAEGRTNRRHVATHASVLRAKLPMDGRGMRAWLRRPVGAVAALTFLPSVRRAHRGVAPAAVRRVSHRGPRTT